MNPKYIFGAGLLLAVALLFVDCGDADDRNVEVVIKERIEERSAALTAKIVDDCQERVITAAIERSDSLLIDRASRRSRIEGRPPRPSRPGEPPVKELSAPLPLRPLFPFEIRFDTLLRDSLYQDSIRVDSIGRGLLLDGRL